LKVLEILFQKYSRTVRTQNIASLNKNLSD